MSASGSSAIGGDPAGQSSSTGSPSAGPATIAGQPDRHQRAVAVDDLDAEEANAESDEGGAGPWRRRGAGGRRRPSPPTGRRRAARPTSRSSERRTTPPPPRRPALAALRRGTASGWTRCPRRRRRRRPRRPRRTRRRPTAALRRRALRRADSTASAGRAPILRAPRRYRRGPTARSSRLAAPTIAGTAPRLRRRRGLINGGRVRRGVSVHQQRHDRSENPAARPIVRIPCHNGPSPSIPCDRGVGPHRQWISDGLTGEAPSATVRHDAGSPSAAVLLHARDQVRLVDHGHSRGPVAVVALGRVAALLDGVAGQPGLPSTVVVAVVRRQANGVQRLGRAQIDPDVVGVVPSEAAGERDHATHLAIGRPMQLRFHGRSADDGRWSTSRAGSTSAELRAPAPDSGERFGAVCRQPSPDLGDAAPRRRPLLRSHGSLSAMPRHRPPGLDQPEHRSATGVGDPIAGLSPLSRRFGEKIHKLASSGESPSTSTSWTTTSGASSSHSRAERCGVPSASQRATVRSLSPTCRPDILLAEVSPLAEVANLECDRRRHGVLSGANDVM